MNRHRKGTRRGQATADVLIILAVVVLAGIAVWGLFGKQIKHLIFREVSALENPQAVGSGNIAAEVQAEVKKSDMSTFDSDAGAGK
jgi:flagellar biosynthesis/type III secretory pathway M-ring protein FliF/YscJ